MTEYDTLTEPTEEERRAEEEAGYAALGEMLNLKDAIFEQALQTRRKIKEAILAYGRRKLCLSKLDGSETRQKAYLQSWSENQHADVLRDEAYDTLWRAVDEYQESYCKEAEPNL